MPSGTRGVTGNILILNLTCSEAYELVQQSGQYAGQAAPGGFGASFYPLVVLLAGYARDHSSPLPFFDRTVAYRLKDLLAKMAHPDFEDSPQAGWPTGDQKVEALIQRAVTEAYADAEGQHLISRVYVLRELRGIAGRLLTCCVSLRDGGNASLQACKIMDLIGQATSRVSGDATYLEDCKRQAGIGSDRK
jgi:hypothetical protein